MIHSFATGAVPAGILILTLFESIGLWVLHRLGVSALPLRKILPTILAGDFLLLAWFATERQAAWPVAGACLLAALAAHARDVSDRVKNA